MKKINSLIIIIIKAATVIFCLFLLIIVVSRLFYPVDLRNYESVVWLPSEFAINGSNPYGYAWQEPYILAPYGFFYYFIVGCGIKVLGLQFWFARLISILSSCVIIYGLKRLGCFITNNPYIIFTSAVFFLTSTAFLSMFGVQRPDLIALASVVSALVLLFEATKQHREAKPSDSKVSLYFFVVVSSLLCFGALFIKQSFVIIPFLLWLWLLREKEIKLAAIFLTTGIFLVIPTVVILNITSQGDYIWQHFTLIKTIPVYYSRSSNVLSDVLMNPATIVSAALVIILIFNSKRQIIHFKISRFILFFVVYFIFAFTLAFTSSMKAGSSANYYLETTFAAAVILIVVLSKLSNKKVLQMVLLILLLAGNIQLLRTIRGEYFRWQDYPYYAEIIKTYNEKVLSDALGVSLYPDLIVSSGGNYHFNDCIQMVDGRSPQLRQFFLNKIKSGYYKAIIWQIPDDELLLTNYRMIPMQTTVPSKGVYPVYLYVLRNENK